LIAVNLLKLNCKSMTKLYCILILIFLGFGSIKAEDKITESTPKAQRIKPFIKLSPTMGWYNVTVADNFKKTVAGSIDNFSFGLSYGGGIDYMFTDNYGFSFELRLLNLWGEGFTYSTFAASLQSATTSTVKNTMSETYFEIPVNFKMQTNEIGYMKYFALLGLTPSVMTSSYGNKDETAFDLNGNPKVLSSDQEISRVDILRRFNLLYNIGAGADYNLSDNTSLVFGATYTSGIFDQSKIDAIILSRRYISLNVGIKF